MRHAQSSGQGANCELTETGQMQAQALAARLEALKIEHLVSSPYRRAVATLEPFANRHAKAIKTVQGLHERILSGTSQPDWRRHIEVSFHDRDYAAPGGESFNQVASRAMIALRDSLAARPGTIAAATHGNLIASVLHKIDPEFGYSDWQGLTNPDLIWLVFEGQDVLTYERVAA
ncbi:MAG: histidine phosphatase family protein [Pseudomonadota bacterium]